MSEVGILAQRDYVEARVAWPMLRPRLEALCSRTSEPWMPDDVLHLIALGQARLWATDDLGGFIVTQVDEQPWGRTMVIWIGSEATDARASDYMDQLRAIAASMDCSRVTFTSPRRWGRALPDLTIRYEYSFEA